MSNLQKEMIDQPDVLIRASERFLESRTQLDELARKIQSGVFSRIILTGMGASYCSCFPLWLKLSSLGLPISMWETSELVNSAPNCISSSTLLIVVSQSGESVETKRLITLSNSPGFRVGITNSSKSSLTLWADQILELCAGDETSVSTKTFLASLAVLHLLGCTIGGGNIDLEVAKLHSLAKQIRVYLENQTEQIERMVDFLGKSKEIVFLGRGYSLAAVNYGALFFQEACRIAAMGFSAAQFRHGPMEIVNPDFGSIIFTGCNNGREMNNHLVTDISAFGGKVIVVTPVLENYSDPSIMECAIPMVDCGLLPLTEILPIQRLAIQLASAQGFEAGVFKNAGKVTVTE
jgi:glutamine---fructose-6-phosphate transaminase (isomerizing)